MYTKHIQDTYRHRRERGWWPYWFQDWIPSSSWYEMTASTYAWSPEREPNSIRKAGCAREVKGKSKGKGKGKGKDTRTRTRTRSRTRTRTRRTRKRTRTRTRTRTRCWYYPMRPLSPPVFLFEVYRGNIIQFSVGVGGKG